MKKAIEFLRNYGVNVTDTGVITSELPDGQNGIMLVDDLENETMENDFCYTIINNKIEKIDC